MGVLAVVLKVIPFALQLIPLVEGMFTKGSDKKAAVAGSAQNVVALLETTGVISADQVAKFPGPTGEWIDATVKYLNAVGALSDVNTANVTGVVNTTVAAVTKK